MAINPFKGFGFDRPEDVQLALKTQLGAALMSGDKYMSRAAVAINAANAIAKPGELVRAEKKEKIFQDAFKKKPKSGDPIEDQIAYLDAVASAAIDAGFPDVAYQASEQIQTMTQAQEERSRLKTAEQRAEEDLELRRQADRRANNQDVRQDGTFEIYKDQAYEEQVGIQLDRANNHNKVGITAYQNYLSHNPNDTTGAEEAALSAQLQNLKAQTLNGTNEEARELGRSRGYFLDSFDPSAAGQDTTKQLKQMTVIMRNGEPELAYIVTEPDGSMSIVPSGEMDAGIFNQNERARVTAEAAGAKEKDPTSQQWAAASDASMLAGAIGNMERLGFSIEHIEEEISKRAQDPSYQAGAGLPGLGFFDRTWNFALNEMRPTDWGLLNQASQDFVQTYLRRESGATIKGEEIVLEESRFIPEPGDPIEKVLQKLYNQRRYLAATTAAAGSVAYRETLKATNRMMVGEPPYAILDGGGPNNGE